MATVNPAVCCEIAVTDTALLDQDTAGILVMHSVPRGMKLIHQDYVYLKRQPCDPASVLISRVNLSPRTAVILTLWEAVSIKVYLQFMADCCYNSPSEGTVTTLYLDIRQY